MTRIILAGVLSCVLAGCATTSPQAASGEPVVVARGQGQLLFATDFGYFGPEDLPVFVREVGDRPVYVSQGASIPLKDLVEVRDRLRAAGVKNVIIGAPPAK